MSDVLSTIGAFAICAAPIVLICLLVYWAAQRSRASQPPNARQQPLDDDEFWEADSPDESPPDFF